MENVINYRALGGMTADGGRKIKEGYFYRSAMLDLANEADVAFLHSLGLRQVFDYRDVDENVGISVYSKIGAVHRAYPTGLKNDKLLRLKETKSILMILRKMKLKEIEPTYRHLPFDNEGYHQMLLAVKNREVPFLQHCSAGKDRAGVGTALLLRMLGVSYPDIEADYMKSLVHKKQFAQMVGNTLPKQYRAFVLHQLDVMFIVHPSLIKATFEEIDSRCGSFENYLLEEHGFTAQDVAAVRDFYLE